MTSFYAFSNHYLWIFLGLGILIIVVGMIFNLLGNGDFGTRAELGLGYSLMVLGVLIAGAGAFGTSQFHHHAYRDFVTQFQTEHHDIVDAVFRKGKTITWISQGEQVQVITSKGRHYTAFVSSDGKLLNASLIQ